MSFDFPKLVEFVLIYIGSSVADSRSLQIAAGAAIIAFGVASIVRLSAEGRLRAEVPWVVLFFFAVFNGFMTGIGRLGFGVGIADSSRYQTVAALTLCATIALVLSAMPKAAELRRSWFGAAEVIFLVLLSTGILAGYFISLDDRVHRNGQKVIAAIALRQGLESEQLLQASTPAPSQLNALLPILRSARHVPFDNEGSRCESFIGRHVPDSGSEQSVGYFDTVSIYDVLDGGQEAIELSGWAEKDGRAAECVIVIDANRLVIGAGASVFQRPDVDRFRRRKLGLVGWMAVAELPQAWPVCVLASFPDSEHWYSLSKCKTIENTTRP